MKTEIRIIGIDDAPFNKFRDKKTLVIGSIFRGGHFMDGLLSTMVDIDGTNSTTRVASMINKCKFKPQLQAIMLDGIAVGGFNVIDVEKLHKKAKIPVIVIMRDYPNFDKIIRTLKKLKMQNKIKLLEKAGKVHKLNKIHVQFVGTKLDKVKSILKISCTHSFVPEPIRVAHLIASGIKTGESRGRA